MTVNNHIKITTYTTGQDMILWVSQDPSVVIHLNLEQSKDLAKSLHKANKIIETKNKEKFDMKIWIPRLLAILLFLVGCFYLTRANAYAVWERGREDYYGSNYSALTIEECVEKIEFHKSEGRRIYDEVKDRCWWLPQLDERQKARRVFSLIVPVVASSGITGKVAAAAWTLFGQYGLDCMEEWDWIQNKWHWFEYHAEKADFYERYLIHVARMVRYEDLTNE